MQKRFALAGAALLVLALQSGAQVTVNNNNSSITVNPTNATGMSSWAVDGYNVLNQQSFWFRTGTNALNQSVSTISAPTVNANGGTLTTTYSDALLSMQITYTLSGNASNTHSSSLAEQINVSYLGSDLGGLQFHFYQYADFVGNGSVNLLQAGGQFFFAQLNVSGLNLNENLNSGLNPFANRGETDAGTLGRITTVANYPLNDTASSTGVGTWAFEWDTTLLPNQPFQIGKTLTISGVPPVPEPATWTLASLGLLAFGAFRRFRNRAK